MTDLLNSLASRALGSLPTVQPRLASRYEASPLAAPPGFTETGGEVVETIRTTPPDDASPAPWPEAMGAPARPAPVDPQSGPGIPPRPSVPEPASLQAAPATLFANDRLEQPAPSVSMLTRPEPVSGPMMAPPMFPHTDEVVESGPRRSEPAVRLEQPVERIVPERVTHELIERRHEIERVEMRSGNGHSVQLVPVESRQSTGQLPLRDVTPMQPEPTPPAIHITIGRIDVRAVGPSAPAAPASRSTPRPAAPSLDDYLRQRSGGRA